MGCDSGPHYPQPGSVALGFNEKVGIFHLIVFAIKSFGYFYNGIILLLSKEIRWTLCWLTGRLVPYIASDTTISYYKLNCIPYAEIHRFLRWHLHFWKSTSFTPVELEFRQFLLLTLPLPRHFPVIGSLQRWIFTHIHTPLNIYFAEMPVIARTCRHFLYSACTGSGYLFGF